MEKWQELFAQAEAKLAAVDELDDIEEVNRLSEEAAKLMSMAEAKKSAAMKRAELREPQMPVELPTDDDSGSQPAPKTEIKANPLYQLRYGEEGAAVKAILRDLHGPDYEQKRWENYQNFVYYLRTGRGENKEIIFTPETVKTALQDGMDVKSMKTVMVEGADNLGGYVVPEDFRAEIISRLPGLTVVRPRARIVQTSRDSVEIPKATGGGSQYRDAVRVTWVDETPTAGTAATNLTFGLERIPIHTVMAETFLSRNLVEDAAFNIVAWLAESYAQAMAIDEDNKFLVGDGTGSPDGILRDSGINALGTGQRVSSGSGSALTWDGLVSMAWKLDAQYRQNAVWIAEKATYEDIAQLKDGDGQYLWRSAYGNNAAEGGPYAPRQLLGFPVLEQEGMPSVAGSAYPLLLCDLRGYIIADRIGLSVERYLDSSTARINQVVYVARRRLGGQVVEPWRFAAQYISS